MCDVSALKYENARLNDQVLAERVKIAETRVECEEKLATLRSQLNVMHKELRTTRQQLDLHQKQNERLKSSKVSKSEFIEVEQKLASKEKEMRRLLQQQEHTTNNSVLEHKVQQLTEELQKVKEENERLRSNTTISSKIRILEKQCADHFRDKAKAEENLRESSFVHAIEVEKLNKTIHQFDETIKRNEAKFQAELKESIDGNTKTQSMLDMQLRDLNEKIRDLKQHNSDLETQLTNTREATNHINLERERVTSQDDQMKTLVIEMESIKQEKVDMQRQIESARNENQQLRVNNDKIKNEFDQLQSSFHRENDDRTMHSAEAICESLKTENDELHKQLEAVKSAKRMVHTRQKDLEGSVNNETQLKEEALMQLSILQSEMQKLQRHCTALEERENDARANTIINIDNRDEDDVAYMKTKIDTHEQQMSQIFSNMLVIEKVAFELQRSVDLLIEDTEYNETMKGHIQSVKTVCSQLMSTLPDILDVF